MLLKGAHARLFDVCFAAQARARSVSWRSLLSASQRRKRCLNIPRVFVNQPLSQWPSIVEAVRSELAACLVIGAQRPRQLVLQHPEADLTVTAGPSRSTCNNTAKVIQSHPYCSRRPWCPLLARPWLALLLRRAWLPSRFNAPVVASCRRPARRASVQATPCERMELHCAAANPSTTLQVATNYIIRLLASALSLFPASSRKRAHVK